MALRRPQIKEQQTADVDIAPLIDMTFLLLIFFICTRQVAYAELDAALTLPQATQGNPEKERDRDRLIVNIDKHGDIYIGRTRFRYEELPGVLANVAAQERDADEFAKRPVFIRADAGLEFGKVQDVMLMCRDARIWKLALRTLRPPEAAARENGP